jgi:hypothetical protein
VRSYVAKSLSESPVDGTKHPAKIGYIKARIGLLRHIKELRTGIPAAPQDSGDVDVVADLSTAEQGGHLVRDSIILMQHGTDGKSHWGMCTPVDAKLNAHLLSPRRPKVDPGEARVPDLDRYFQLRCPVSSDSCIDPLSETARAPSVVNRSTSSYRRTRKPWAWMAYPPARTNPNGAVAAKPILAATSWRACIS